jgi:hypothetical protein
MAVSSVFGLIGLKLFDVTILFYLHLFRLCQLVCYAFKNVNHNNFWRIDCFYKFRR